MAEAQVALEGSFPLASDESSGPLPRHPVLQRAQELKFHEPHSFQNLLNRAGVRHREAREEAEAGQGPGLPTYDAGNLQTGLEPRPVPPLHSLPPTPY